MRWLLAFFLFGLVHGQAIIDHVELIDDPVTGLPVLATIHITSQPDYVECQTRNFYTCIFIVTRPYLPEDMADTAADELEKLESEYRENLAKTIDAEVNKLPPCYVPPVCAPVPQPLPIPDMACIFSRVQAGITKALAKYEAKYWADVTKTMYTYLPNTITWEAPLPIGSMFSPIYSLTPKPDQYFRQYTSDPREIPYFTNGVPPYFTIPVPLTPLEANIVEPGIQKFERQKRRFDAASFYEYQQFGFSTFFSVYTELRPFPVYGSDVFPPNFFPGIQAYCMAGPLFIPLPFKLPIPIVIPLPVLVAQSVTVAEGYQIPFTEYGPFPALP